MLPTKASIAILRWNRCVDLDVGRADPMHDFDREAMGVERAARGEHDRGGGGAAEQQHEPEREPPEAAQRAQQRRDACPDVR